MRIFFNFIVILFLGTMGAEAENDSLSFLFNPHTFNSPCESYDQQTSTVFGRISNLVYEKKKKIDQVIHDINLGYGTTIKALFYDDKKADIQYLVIGFEKTVIIAFRGTEIKKRDLVTDAFFYQGKVDTDDYRVKYGLPFGHQGFRESAIHLIRDSVFTVIQSFIRDSMNLTLPDAHLYLTGHSLGAGLAQFMIWPFRLRGYSIKGIYLFAPPLAVNCGFAKKLRSEYGRVTYDIVNELDYVPRLGLIGVFGHFGRFQRICDGLVYAETERYIIRSFWQSLSCKEFTNHQMKNYLKAIVDPLNSNLKYEERITNQIICNKYKTDPAFCVCDCE